MCKCIIHEFGFLILFWENIIKSGANICKKIKRVAIWEGNVIIHYDLSPFSSHWHASSHSWCWASGPPPCSIRTDSDRKGGLGTPRDAYSYGTSWRDGRSSSEISRCATSCKSLSSGTMTTVASESWIYDQYCIWNIISSPIRSFRIQWCTIQSCSIVLFFIFIGYE